MGSNASSGLGNEATYGLQDLRRMETENEAKTPSEHPEETNSNLHDLFPDSKTSHSIIIMSL